MSACSSADAESLKKTLAEAGVLALRIFTNIFWVCMMQGLCGGFW